MVLSDRPRQQTESREGDGREQATRSVLRALQYQKRGLAALEQAIDGPLGRALGPAIETLFRATGRVIVCGMGKSGHIGRKIAATLASTGTPAFFLHPAEASHGDLGMVTEADVLLALSWSGETAELHAVVDYARRFRVPLLVITSQPGSTLGRAADVLLPLPAVDEACPNRLAPTTSTLLQLVLGDAIALALLEKRGFTPEAFRVFHPGGKLGAQLMRVRDLMHKGADLPLAGPETPLSEAVLTMSSGRLGCVVVTGQDGELCGILTDGDIRRGVAGGDFRGAVGDLMTRSPRVVAPDQLAGEALASMNAQKITVLVVAEGNKPVGIVHLHDILSRGIV